MVTILGAPTFCTTSRKSDSDEVDGVTSGSVDNSSPAVSTKVERSLNIAFDCLDAFASITELVCSTRRFTASMSESVTPLRINKQVGVTRCAKADDTLSFKMRNLVNDCSFNSSFVLVGVAVSSTGISALIS